MANTQTPVATGQRLVAGAATAHCFHVTWYVVAELVLAHTHLGCEKRAGRTPGLPVTGVRDRMRARMFSRTRLSTLEWLGAAPYRRILNGGAAVAHALLKRRHQTPFAQRPVAELLTLVQTTVEHAIADEHAHVLV